MDSNRASPVYSVGVKKALSGQINLANFCVKETAFSARHFSGL